MPTPLKSRPVDEFSAVGFGDYCTHTRYGGFGVAGLEEEAPPAKSGEVQSCAGWCGHGTVEGKGALQ